MAKPLAGEDVFRGFTPRKTDGGYFNSPAETPGFLLFI
jgi:hypothetical protein